MKKLSNLILKVTFVVFLFVSVANSQIGTVINYQKISQTEGNFQGILSTDHRFGDGVTGLGDLDGDGVTDIAVGSPYSGGGTVWILFLNQDGTVKTHKEIKYTDIDTGNPGFGMSLTSLGDLDDDGVVDIAVGGSYLSDIENHSGGVWILFLNSDGSVKATQRISNSEGNLPFYLAHDATFFGWDLDSIGDFDGDGLMDLAVSALYEDYNMGAIYILFLNSDGTVKDTSKKISSTDPIFNGDVDYNSYFAHSVTSLGDLDGDEITDIAVGHMYNNDGGTHKGCVWILFLNSDGTVKSIQKISDSYGNFANVLDDNDCFGAAATSTGDIDGDGVPDLAVSATYDNDGGTGRGAVYILFLNPNGTVKNYTKISDTAGNFDGVINDGDHFGTGISFVGDVNQDGAKELVVGAPMHDDGGSNKGAVWVLFLEGPDITLDALIDIAPDTLNVKSHGQYVTAYITLPDGYDVGEIDATTIAITSLLGTSCDPEYTQFADLSFVPQVGDRDEDGILDLTVKFDRQVLIQNLCLDDVEIVIEGDLNNGVHFTGKDKIRVIDRGK